MTLTSVLLVLTALFFLEPQATRANDGSYESLVKSLFDEVLDGVEDMRGLPPPKGIELNIVSIQWFSNQEEEKVQEKSEEIDLEETVYKALFLIPQDFSVGEARVKQASSIRAAVVGSRLYIVKEHFDPLDGRAARRTLAHEITHLLQSRFRSPRLATFDQRQAWISLVEGDADFTADTYIASSGLSSYVAAVTESLDRIQVFPYRYGSGFVSALFTEGGWSLINSAYDNPPRSTEAVLHPEIYLSNRSFTVVTALTPESNEWVAVFTDTFGEYFIRIMLENGVSEDEAERAAAGWDGDNVTLINKDGSYLLTWRISWDTVEDASEFLAAYRRMVVQMGGEEVEPGLYGLQGHYVTFTGSGRVTEISSSTNRQSVISVRMLMGP